jgi:MFS family permease
MYAPGAGFEILFVARLLWGLAWSGIWIGGNAIVLEMATERERGRWVGIYQVWFFSAARLERSWWHSDRCSGYHGLYGSGR